MAGLIDYTSGFLRQLKKEFNRNWPKEISSSPIYILIACILCLTSITLLWAILYRIKPTSHGIGLTVKRGVVNRVYTPIGGRIVSVKVKLGDEVRKGDVIATIDNTNELISSSNRDEVAKLSDKLSPAQIESQEISTMKQITATKASLRTLEVQLANNKVLLDRMTNLVGTKDISYSEFLAQQKIVDDIKIQILSLRGKVKSLESDLFKLTIDAKSSQINDKQDAQLAKYNLDLTRSIIARQDGLITLIDVSPGDYVKEGDTIAQVTYKTGVIKGVFVMPANMAKRVKPGDMCLVSPAESPPERYGYVKATAESIGVLPTNPGEFQRKIGLDYTTEQLFDHLNNIDNGNSFNAFPYLVIVSIDMKNGKPVWTTGLVPPWGFVSGTAADVQCVYDQWSPLEYIIPTIRKEAGYVRVN